MFSKLFFHLSKIWRLIRGSTVLRFSIFLVGIGASFMVPQIWEAMLEVIADIINFIFRRDVITSPTLKSDYTPQPKDYWIGSSIILVGVILFSHFTSKRLANFSNNSLKIYEKLQYKWSLANYIHPDPEKALAIDIVYAINLINETSALLLTIDSKTRTLFLDSRSQDFKELYVGLETIPYMVGDKEASILLSKMSKSFYKKFIHYEKVNSK